MLFRSRSMMKILLSENVNIASQLTSQNVIYVIQYDFDLLDEMVTIPSGCVLDFQGGSIINGTIVFDDTYILFNRESGSFQNCQYR